MMPTFDAAAGARAWLKENGCYNKKRFTSLSILFFEAYAFGMLQAAETIGSTKGGGERGVASMQHEEGHVR